MFDKFGLTAGADAVPLIMDGLQLLAQDHVDYTIFLRRLCDFDSTAGALNAPVRDLFRDRAAFDAWATRYAVSLRASGTDSAARATAMRAVNPKYILRNHLAEVAIRRAADHRDYSEINRLHALLLHPFDEQPEFEAYAAEPPDWASEIEVSCSS